MVGPLEAEMSDLGDDLKEIGNRTGECLLFLLGAFITCSDYTTGVFESKKS